MVDFRIENYDKGGNNAIAGDGQLTGSEVKKAQKDGWTVWDGYNANDPAPENPKALAAEAKAEAEKQENVLDIDRFDKGGEGAIPGDGKLTGDEALRARRAGYTYAYDDNLLGVDISKDGIEQHPYLGKRDKGYAFGGISRAAANATDNKFVYGCALVADMLCAPVTIPTSFIQVFMR